MTDLRYNVTTQWWYVAVLQRMGEVTYRTCIISEQLSHYQFLPHHKSSVIESLFQLIFCFLYILASSETTCAWRRTGGSHGWSPRWQSSLLSIESSAHYHRPVAVLLFWLHCQGSWANIIPTPGWQQGHHLLFGGKGHSAVHCFSKSLKLGVLMSVPVSTQHQCWGASFP